jgi:multiple sugar transport system permease protein
MSNSLVISPGKSRSGNMARREALEGWFFISLAVIGFIVFKIGPILASLYFSLTRYDIVTTPKWSGIQNYLDMTQDALFWQSLRVTTVYTLLSVPLSLVLGLMLALLLNQKIKGVLIYRTIYYIPSVISGVAVAVLWKWIFNPEFGVINLLLGKIGIQGPEWLFSRTWALPSLVLMSLWGVGWVMLINLAGLQDIPSELYEAAEIDGANSIRRFLHITLPMLSPVIFFNLVTSIIWSFQTFTQGYVMTGGGPANATLFYVLHLYRNAFQFFKMGYASALAWVLFLIVLLLTLLVFRSSPAWVFYESERK